MLMINPILTKKIMKISEIWTSSLDFLGQAWWVEVLTVQPKCTYYFGPFGDERAASLAIAGYVEDLKGESAQGIQTQVKRCKPSRLTIEQEDGDRR
jgi:Domain of unknown function (DUF1816)